MKMNSEGAVKDAENKTVGTFAVGFLVLKTVSNEFLLFVSCPVCPV